MSRRRDAISAALLLAVFAGAGLLALDFAPTARRLPLLAASAGALLCAVQLRREMWARESGARRGGSSEGRRGVEAARMVRGAGRRGPRGGVRPGGAGLRVRIRAGARRLVAGGQRGPGGAGLRGGSRGVRDASPGPALPGLPPGCGGLGKDRIRGPFPVPCLMLLRVSRILRPATSALLLVLVLGSAPVGPTAAEDGGEFFRGKAITYLVGNKPGGGYDLYARLIARHLPHHLPVERVVVMNVPGAGGRPRPQSALGRAPRRTAHRHLQHRHDVRPGRGPRQHPFRPAQVQLDREGRRRASRLHRQYQVRGARRGRVARPREAAHPRHVWNRRHVSYRGRPPGAPSRPRRAAGHRVQRRRQVDGAGARRRGWLRGLLQFAARADRSERRARPVPRGGRGGRGRRRAIHDRIWWITRTRRGWFRSSRSTPTSFG